MPFSTMSNNSLRNVFINPRIMIQDLVVNMVPRYGYHLGKLVGREKITLPEFKARFRNHVIGTKLIAKQAREPDAQYQGPSAQPNAPVLRHDHKVNIGYTADVIDS